MSNSFLNTGGFLRNSRAFPEDAQPLSVELNKAYLDIANNVNSRTIGNYATQAAITGNTWYTSGNNTKQQTLRQVYMFSAAGSIAHGISSFTGIAQGYGYFTDGTNSYGVIFGSNTSIAGQVSFYVTATNIVVLSGSGAPSITSGTIVLEWISQS